MPFEDFTTYNETDTDTKLSVTAQTITWATYERDDEGYFEDDKGAGNIGDFRYAFEIDLSAYSGAVDDTPLMWPVGVSDGLGTRAALVTANTQFLAVELKESADATKHLKVLESDGVGFWASSAITLSPYGDRYYIIFEKKGTACRLTARNTSHRGTSEGQVSLTLQSDETYRYVLAAVSADDSGTNPTHYSSGTLDNLDLIAPVYNTTPCHFKPPVGSVIDTGHPLAQGINGCWLFNEGVGRTVYDISGNGNHMALTNDAGGGSIDWVNVSGIGRSLEVTPGDLDGGHASITTDAFMTPSASFVLWVQRISDVIGNEYILTYEQSTSSRYLVRIMDGDFQGYDDIANDGNMHTFGSGVIASGIWYCVAVVFNEDGTKDAFLNGVKQTTDPTGSNLTSMTSGATLYLGGLSGTGAYANVYYGSLTAYSRALTAHETRTLHAYPYAFIRQPSVLDVWVPPVAGADNLAWRLAGSRPALAGTGGLAG